ncbi:ABC transporter ATP-binding protein [Microcella humidisoli]|uniref:ABC transporter ATP-binding protein n=1 Tax=Microcella humidisoli TaxID=2963406 RepID=A0ABY5FWX9_9MICO|nr:ABC transporter ATP-binding protein [Microcella humidisoli]UTT62821.1 ABC transporter ATP-binding protein [Microcella humidisoli]
MTWFPSRSSAPQADPADAGLRARSVSVAAGSTMLVDDIDLEAAAGTVTAVVGPNGAGKSSVLAALARLHGTGVVELGGDDLSTMTRRRRAQLVAMVQQSTETDIELTVRDAIALGRTPHVGAWGDDSESGIVDESLDAVGMTAFADRALLSLSGGERQRVALGMALAQRPRLLIVDEPSNHLDIAAQLSIMSLLRRLASEGVTVVVALHDLALALEFSDNALVLSRGLRIAHGRTLDILSDELISTVYGVDARILVDAATGRRAISFGARRESPSVAPASQRQESRAASPAR